MSKLDELEATFKALDEFKKNAPLAERMLETSQGKIMLMRSEMETLRALKKRDDAKK